MVTNLRRLQGGSGIYDRSQLRCGGHSCWILLSLGSWGETRATEGKRNLPFPSLKQEPSVLVKPLESLAKIEQVKRVSISNHFHLSSVTKNERAIIWMGMICPCSCLSDALKPLNPCYTRDEGKGNCHDRWLSFCNLSKKRPVKYKEIVEKMETMGEHAWFSSQRAQWE